MGKTKKILRGKFPKENLSLDQQVKVANRAGEVLVQALNLSNEPEDVMDEVNNFALWLGGCNLDVQVYAWQLVRRYHGITVYADDKTYVRMQPLEDKIFENDPYCADTFRDIVHYAWPKVWLNESTFEERLETLAEEFESEESPADMLLSGTGVPEDLDFNQRFQLAQDCVEDLNATYTKTGPGKRNPVLTDRLDRYLGWCLTIEPEIVIFSVSQLMKVHKIMFDPTGMTHWDTFKAQYGPMVMIG